MNTIVFNQEIDNILYSAGFHYVYASGPGKDYRSIEKYDGLKCPIIFRNCFPSERTPGEVDCVVLYTEFGSVKWKIPFIKFTETMLREIVNIVE